HHPGDGDPSVQTIADRDVNKGNRRKTALSESAGHCTPVAGGADQIEREVAGHGSGEPRERGGHQVIRIEAADRDLELIEVRKIVADGGGRVAGYDGLDCVDGGPEERVVIGLHCALKCREVEGDL